MRFVKEPVREVKHVSSADPPGFTPRAGRSHRRFHVSVITATGRHRTVMVIGNDEMDVYRRILLEGI